MRVIESITSRALGSAAWDALVAADARGHLLQTWAWGELKAGFGWTPVRVAIEQDGCLVAGAQVLYRRLGPWRVGYIPKGPVFAQQSPQITEALWQALHARSRRMRAMLLKVEPEWQDQEVESHQMLRSYGLRPSAQHIQPRSTIIVELTDDEEAMLARMKPKWRYNIRLSQRKGVQVREGSLDDLPTFYALLRVTGERDGFGIHTRAYYERALGLFYPEGRCALFIATFQGQPLAGLMAYAFNGQAWYMYGASGNVYRELMPNHQLQWCAMCWAKSRGCRQYDLWGITDREGPEASAALAGVERFKAGFGGQVVRYVGAYDYVYAPPWYWLMDKIWALRRAA